MNDLVVDGHLAAIVVDDEDTDGATAVVEALGETAKEAALVEDGEALLDITGLGHGDDTAIVTDVEDTVLLEDRAEHVLDNNGRAGVADEGRLLVQLLGEEVNTEVTVLTGLSRGGDADDLARTALQDQQVADPDVVAGDGNSVGNHVAAGRTDGGVAVELGLVAGSGGGDFAVTDDDVLFDALDGRLLVVVLVVGAAVDGVKNLVRGAVKSVAEGVVVAVFVVISHVTLVLARLVDSSAAHANLFLEGDGLTLGVPLVRVLTRVGALAFPLTGFSVVLLGVGSGAVTVLPFSCVDTAVEVLAVLVLAVVGAVLDVDLVVGVALVGFTVVLLAANVDVYAVVVAVVVAAGGVEARVETLLFTAVLETGVATVVLVDTDVLFLGHAYGLRATAVVLGDADVFAEAFFVTGRGGFLGSSWWLLTFPSSALDRDLLFSLDLFGLLGVFVGRRKDAERDWDSGVEIQPGDFAVT